MFGRKLTPMKQPIIYHAKSILKNAGYYYQDLEIIKNTIVLNRDIKETTTIKAWIDYKKTTFLVSAVSECEDNALLDFERNLELSIFNYDNPVPKWNTYTS